MKVAIHYNERSFADGWISYCKKHDILYKIVNAYDTNIISQLEDCDFFMWHHHHANYKDALFAKQLLYSLEIAGKKVFPNYHTCWHFDDKVGQKYLLESIGAPLVPSYVFYTKKEALDWINGTSFPKVFKLRGGAGSANVLLVHNKSEAIKLARQSFGKGFSQFNGWSNFKERFEKWRLGKTSVLAICKGLARVLIPTEYAKMHSPEKGYIYLQSLSSMIPPIVLNPKPKKKILDLTAAPGSKTTQLSAIMENQGYILANELDKIRCERLKYNVDMQGAKIVEVVNGRGEKIGEKYQKMFDKVLLDAPCSGEGRFCARNVMSYRNWSLKTVKDLSKLVLPQIM